MSRIGLQPIEIPSGVEVSVAGSSVTVKGKDATITTPLPEAISAKVEDNRVVVERRRNDKRTRSLHGLVRSR